MITVSSFRPPEWYEKKLLICNNCGHTFLGFKILSFTKCPRCGSRNVSENPLIRH